MHQRTTPPKDRRSHAPAQKNYITLEEIDTADAFVGRMEKIELPSQMAAILADPLLQKLLLLRPDSDAAQRLDNWLAAVFDDVRRGHVTGAALEEVLGPVASYIARTNVRIYFASPIARYRTAADIA